MPATYRHIHMAQLSYPLRLRDSQKYGTRDIGAMHGCTVLATLACERMLRRRSSYLGPCVICSDFVFLYFLFVFVRCFLFVMFFGVSTIGVVFLGVLLGFQSVATVPIITLAVSEVETERYMIIRS